MKPTIAVKGLTQIPSACNWLSNMLAKGLGSGKPVIVTLSREGRSEAQNRHLWPLCQCFAEQKEFNHRMFKKEDWKLILLSAFKNDPSGIMLGIHGEVINTNLSSSELKKAEFAEFLESIYAQGAEWGIRWSDPALQIYDEWGIN